MRVKIPLPVETGSPLLTRIMATGGWSGNESIIYAMRENYVLWATLWESSHRGGLEVFDVSKVLSA